MSDRYCVFGHPIGHSLSPRIHAAFAEQTGEEMSYEAIEAPRKDFAGAWHNFVASGGRGANVTVPFKEDAYRLGDVLSPRARLAGAVNTLVLGRNDEIFGDNTDGVGLVRDLQAQAAPLEKARILVLGAGGAVRGILEPLLAARPATLMIANRTPEKARQLAKEFSELGETTGGGFDEIVGTFDLVVNGTSASLGGECPPLPEDVFADDALAYDMMYADEPTTFLRWSAEHDARTADGLGMLIEQAAESFFLWRNVRPDTAALRKQLRPS
ncbi:shikimate dehydrogenase [Halomonas sp. PR-M31]|uniref:shikimate dehydrogenase n=1 Tax=Halomonas sp. PR-M31 TaxID=1471202 RepID=UPI00065214B4|nr:shikimate dehydrogenase [Halomonas sp. PR-M31]